jgi:hypothetical protein
MVAPSFQGSTRKLAFAPIMIRRNGAKTTNNYPPLPASPIKTMTRRNRVNKMMGRNGAKTTENYPPLPASPRNNPTKSFVNQYVNNLRSRFQTRKQMNNALYRNTNISVNDKSIIREMLKRNGVTFSQNASNDNKNTREKVKPYIPKMPYKRSITNMIFGRNRTANNAFQRNLVESRHSGYMSINNGKMAIPPSSEKVAKIAANLSAARNEPQNMISNAEKLNIDSRTKREVINYIKHLYNL